MDGLKLYKLHGMIEVIAEIPTKRFVARNVVIACIMLAKVILISTKLYTHTCNMHLHYACMYVQITYEYHVLLASYMFNHVHILPTTS